METEIEDTLNSVVRNILELEGGKVADLVGKSVMVESLNLKRVSHETAKYFFTKISSVEFTTDFKVSYSNYKKTTCLFRVILKLENGFKIKLCDNIRQVTRRVIKDRKVFILSPEGGYAQITIL